MPWCASVVDELREVFGKAEIDAVLRAGLRPGCRLMERVYFREGGNSLGVGLPADLSMCSAADMVIGPQVAAPKRGGR